MTVERVIEDVKKIDTFMGESSQQIGGDNNHYPKVYIHYKLTRFPIHYPSLNTKPFPMRYVEARDNIDKLRISID